MHCEKTILLFRFCITLSIVLVAFTDVNAQLPGRRPIRPIGDQGQIPNLNNSSANKDTFGFKHRDDLADSITISYKNFDSLTSHSLDTTINDFGKNFSLPSGYVTIGGNGNAAYPVLFQPFTKPGWDPGFHAYDVYKFTLSNTRFFQTTRPYTSINFYQSSNKEQVIRLLHTQNIKPNWNAGFEYRLISNPGVFQNQNVKHNNYRFFTSYQGRRKRYAAQFVILGNKLISAENGGIADLSLLSDPTYKRRETIPVLLGNNSAKGPAFFSSRIAAGNRYNDLDVYLSQRYDFGKKDSIMINDSTKEYLFYPKFRLQHSAQFIQSTYKFADELPNFETAKSDSVFFADYYNLTIKPNASDVSFMDQWQFISNDFSIRQFPETKNQYQYLEAGVRLENYKGDFTRVYIPSFILIVYPLPPVSRNYYNTVLHGAYKNKTRNQKWDMELNGELYAAGFYAGDYKASASIQRYLNPKWGTVRLFGENTSRSPSFVFQSNSAFNIDSTSLTKRENITILGFMANNPRFQLFVRNISIANYAYFTNFWDKVQYSGFINLTQGSLSTKNKITGHLNLYSDFILQLTAGKNPIHVPLFYTRQRIAFEGNFFKNLNLSAGLDVSYNSPYKADNYSPVAGRFLPQDSITISNLPTVNAFFNFRIKSFTMFLKTENLNTAQIKKTLEFTKNSFAAPRYPTPGFIFRMGIRWNMVN